MSRLVVRCLGPLVLAACIAASCGDDTSSGVSDGFTSLVTIPPSSTSVPVDEDFDWPDEPFVGDTAPPSEPILGAAGVELGEIELPETSALLASSSEPDVYWTVQDAKEDENRARLIGIRVVNGELDRTYGDDGTRLVSVANATNVDWETLSDGPNGTIFIGDVGNNDCQRPDQRVLQVNQPIAESESVSVTATFNIAFPDTTGTCGGKNVEASFLFDETLYLLAKTDPAVLYRLSDPAIAGSNSLDRLGPIGQPEGGFAKPPTAMALNDAGTRLAIAIAGERFFVYEIPPGTSPMKALATTAPAYSRFYAAGEDLQIEGASFVPGTDDLILIAENKSVWLWPATSYEAGKF